MAAGGAPLGREAEQRRVVTLLAEARNGHGGALVLRGDPGIGKTTLLEATVGTPPGGLRLRLGGYEAESQIPFAAIQRLLIPLRGYLSALSDQHRRALLVAVGDEVGPPPDRYLVGLGVLGLLAAASADGPVVCAVDDAHLLDPESLDALAFVARRLEAEAVAVVLAARDTEQIDVQLAGVPSLRLEGLPLESAVTLLLRSLREELDPAIAMQVAAATGGNPLALVDLAAELSVRRLTESSFGEEPFPVGRTLETFYLRQVRLLAEPLQTWLLLAAAESTGDLALLGAAAEALGLDEALWEDGVAAGLVEVDGSVRFRHPLVRAAAYTAASGRDRRRVHQVLSSTADALGHAERAAWHAAQATLGTDEAVARRLEAVADLAGQRGGFASRANVLARAAALSEGPERHRRLVAAAEAALAAGKGTLAKALLDDVDEDALDVVGRARLVSLGAQLALFTADPAVVRGTAEMLRAAALMTGLDPHLEQDTLVRAWEVLLPVQEAAEGVTPHELAERMRAGAAIAPGPASAILDGLAALVLEPYAEAVPHLRRAFAAVEALDDEACRRYGSTGVAMTTALWDNEGRARCLTRAAEAARTAGSLQMLDMALWVSSIAETIGGAPRRANQYIEQVRELRRAIGFDAEHVVNTAVLAWNGVPREQVMALADAASAVGFEGVRSTTLMVVGTVDLAHAHYDLAHQVLEPLMRAPFLHVGPMGFPAYVEACARTGHVDEAHAFLAELERRAELTGTDWARGVARRSRALLSTPGEAEPHYEAAIALLTGNLAEVELGWSHLVYGEWLRRQRRRAEARRQLDLAADVLTRAGADVFLTRVNQELSAMGDPERTGTDTRGLTPQEATIAALAAAGATNAEIGAGLFISTNTVDYHLRKVYQKLGVTSRRQLSDHLQPHPAGADPDARRRPA